MESYTLEEILEKINELIDLMSEHEDELYVAIEVAHQMRDEVIQTLPEESDDE